MIKQALEYLVGLGQVKTLDINGQTYSTERLDHVKIPKTTALQVNSLTGLLDYIKSGFDSDSFVGTLVHVVSYDKVRLISQLLNDAGREDYMIAEAFSPVFRFNKFYDHESFIIAMQSCFVPNVDSAVILQVVGNIRDEAVRNFGDDGVSQMVSAKTGIALVEDVKVPNPVMLAPFRTFVEIEQPESKFVFRMRSGENGPECALFEADGGAWRLDAMENIKEYLQVQLKDTGINVIA